MKASRALTCAWRHNVPGAADVLALESDDVAMGTFVSAGSSSALHYTSHSHSRVLSHCSLPIILAYGLASSSLVYSKQQVRV